MISYFYKNNFFVFNDVYNCSLVFIVLSLFLRFILFSFAILTKSVFLNESIFFFTTLLRLW